MFQIIEEDYSLYKTNRHLERFLSSGTEWLDTELEIDAFCKNVGAFFFGVFWNK